MLYLEDLSVGQQFKSRSYMLSEEEILSFAEKFDPQPFHTDTEKAKKHPIFQGLAASGWHTAAIVMRLWTECFPIANGLIGSEVSLRWPRPTRANDQIRVEVEISEIIPSKSKPDRALVTYVTQALNQDDQVLYSSQTKIVVLKRPQ